MDEITQLKKKIEELESRLADLSKLLEIGQDVFYRTDAEGRLTFITPTIERYSGYSPAQLLGSMASKVYAIPEEREHLVQELRRTGTVSDYELCLVDVSGNTHFVSLNARVIFENGAFAGVEGVMRDRTRRKRLELKVVESEQRFRMLAESSPVGIFRTDSLGNCIFINSKWCDLAGLTGAEALGSGWQRALHPDDRARVVREWTAVCAEGRPYETQCRFRTSAGQVSWVHVNAAPLRDEAGTFVGHVGSVTDTTRIQRAEQTIRNLGSIVESFEDAIIVCTLDGIILSWNKAAERIYGHTAAETVGRHVDSLKLVDHHWDLIRPSINRLLAGQHLEPIRATRTRKDGTIFRVGFTLSLIWDVAGNPIGVTGISRDITARLDEEDALRRSEETFRAVFNYGPVGIAMAGSDLRFERVNPMFAQMLGWTESELIGMHIAEVTHPDDIENGTHLAQSLFRREIPYYSVEKRYQRKNGSLLWVSLTATIVPDRNGNPLFGLAMIENISSRKEYEQERDQMISQLQEALASVKTLSGLLPMCAWCKRIRDEGGSWSDVEVYVEQRSDADFTHGICPDCQERVRLDLGLNSDDNAVH